MNEVIDDDDRRQQPLKPSEPRQLLTHVMYATAHVRRGFQAASSR